MLVASDVAPAARARRTAHLRCTVRTVGTAILAPLVLLGFTALVFFDELTGGPIAYGRDTASFYYPLTEWAANELQQGRLPLWIPLIFGGYPLLADGEVGPLYPPNLLALGLLPTSTAYAWLRAFHYAVAALGVFAYARTLRISRVGALIGALAFGFGSFMVGHLQHDNIVRSAAWLPWLLLATERAVRAEGVTRAMWSLAGALVLALQCLGVHIQPVLLSVLIVAVYLLVGPLVPGPTPPPNPPPRGGEGEYAPPLRLGEGAGGRGSALSAKEWLRGRVRVGLAIVGLGVGLAAAQVLPLYLLGQQALRPSLVTYDYATSYAVAPPQLLTLLFPYMFHFDVERSWALWSQYESTLYVGIAPLILSVLALGLVRTRTALFFGVAALISLVLALGDYLPIKAYTVIWTLPGFSLLRAPARFSLLFELALAILAALGTDWVARRARAGAVPRGLVRLLAGAALVPAALALVLLASRWWLQQDPGSLLELFRATYVDLRKENWALGPWHVYYGLLELSRPSNARTAVALFLLMIVPLLLRAWLSRPDLGRLWQTGLAVLVAADLWCFATGFHPQATVDELRPVSPVIDYLVTVPGPYRIAVEPALNHAFGPNQLVPFDLAIVNGYSSLEPRRHSQYWWSMVTQESFLADLFNVRYVVAAQRVFGLQSFERTRYHPHDRLMSGRAGSPAGVEQFRVPSTRVAGLTIVAAVERLDEAGDGAPVAELTLSGPSGERRVLNLRAGLDVGPFEASEPGYPSADEPGPRVAWAGTMFVARPESEKANLVRLYGVTHTVDPPLEVTRLEIRALTTSGRLHVHGLGLRTEQDSVYSVNPTDNAKYRTLYDAPDVLLVENTLAWPRAYVVGGAIPAEPGTAVVDQLLDRSWDPRREIIVDGTAPANLYPASGDGPVGRAELLSYEPRRVVVRAELAAPGYLVLADRDDGGWRAWLENRELPILRANAIQRAVALPAGSHVVTFVYDPLWVKLGFAISSLFAIGIVGVLGAAGGTLARESRLARRAVAPAP